MKNTKPHTTKQPEFLPDPDILKWIETSQLMFQSPDNYNTQALFFWGRYTASLMERFAGDRENMGLMESHMADFASGRRAA